MAAVALTAGGSPVRDRAFGWSLAGHGLLLLLVLIGGLSLPRSPPPTQLAIKATVVDSTATRQPPTAPRPAPPVRPKPLPESKAAPKPESKPEPQPEPKPDPRLEQRRVEQQKQEKDRQQAAEREKALREKQRTDQLKAQKAAEEQEKEAKQEREKAAAEKLQADKLKADKLKAERLKAERLKAERLKADAAEREIARQIEAEERLLAATDSGALADYAGMISQKVTRNWIRPASTAAGLECVVEVTQIPGGEVIGVRVERCNGDAAVVRSIEAAVLKASPLPLPDDAALFDRSLRFTFKPEQ